MIISSYPIYAGYTKNVQIPIETARQAWVKVSSNVIEHVMNVETEIQFSFKELEVGQTYQFTYEVFDYVNCSMWFQYGINKGEVRTANGIYTETITILKPEDKLIKFVSDGKLKVRNLSIKRKRFLTKKVPFGDSDKFENRGFTLSYDPTMNEGQGGWVSFHSYLPNYYMASPNNLYSYWRDAAKNSLYKHHENEIYTTFFGTPYDYIIEIISLSNPLMTRTWEDITLQINVKRYDLETGEYQYLRDIAFDKVILYNSRQSSGELNMIVKHDEDDYLGTQIVNEPNSIIISENEHNWRFNDIRDHVVDYSKPLFTRAWNSIKESYPIDKVVNEAVIDYLKNWYELETFTDKYLAIRLIYSKFADKSVELTTNYSIENEQDSIR